MRSCEVTARQSKTNLQFAATNSTAALGSTPATSEATTRKGATEQASTNPRNEGSSRARACEFVGAAASVRLHRKTRRPHVRVTAEARVSSNHPNVATSLMMLEHTNPARPAHDATTVLVCVHGSVADARSFGNSCAPCTNRHILHEPLPPVCRVFLVRVRVGSGVWLAIRTLAARHAHPSCSPPCYCSLCSFRVSE